MNREVQLRTTREKRFSRRGDTMLSLLGLLLLLSCLSCAETDTSSAATVDQRPACQPDIHAVLREMTALMTEQRTELRHTQQELKSALDRLQDSERLVKEQRVQLQATTDRLNNSETLIKEQRVQLQATIDRLKDSESLVKDLQVAVERLTDSDSLIKARLNATQHEVQFLQKLNEVSRVSFSASLVTSGSGNTGPYNAQTILIYKHVITNVGNGYNPHTGVFTAALRGVYHFTIYVHGLGASHATGAVLVKNGQHVVVAYGHQTSHRVDTSNGASLLLEPGDVVYVNLWTGTWIHDSYHHQSTFSGHLLFTV